MKNKPNVLVIVGPTASGKTSLSIAIAQHFNGEVISADSRQVYRGLDIGSGKVTAEEMDGVPHHLLDVADPMDVYTASDFNRDGQAAIAKIHARSALPIVAGGTFFYVDTLLGKIITPNVPPNPELRSQLEEMSTEVLFHSLEELDPDRAFDVDEHNRPRVIRALEIVEALGKVPKQHPEERYNVLTLGVDISKEQLHENIHTRLLQRMDEGMLEEVEELLRSGVTHDRLQELGLEYRYLSLHLQGKLAYDAMIEELETKIRQFAKRQMTWLKRDRSINWFQPSQTEQLFSTITAWID